jgi:hypothetical protein
LLDVNAHVPGLVERTFGNRLLAAAPGPPRWTENVETESSGGEDETRQPPPASKRQPA